MLFLKILGQDIWGKPLLILGVMLFIAGVQFLTTGIFAELIMRTYFESQNKRPYNIKSVRNFEELSEERRKDSTKAAD